VSVALIQLRLVQAVVGGGLGDFTTLSLRRRREEVGWWQQDHCDGWAMEVYELLNGGFLVPDRGIGPMQEESQDAKLTAATESPRCELGFAIGQKGQAGRHACSMFVSGFGITVRLYWLELNQSPNDLLFGRSAIMWPSRLRPRAQFVLQPRYQEPKFSDSTRTKSVDFGRGYEGGGPD